jgi:hypothetical protein
MAVSALTTTLIRLIAKHGLVKGPRLARQMGFSTKHIQKAFNHPSLNKYPKPDGRQLRYANRKPEMSGNELLQWLLKQAKTIGTKMQKRKGS